MMENTEKNTNRNKGEEGFTAFATKKIVIGILIAVVFLWSFSMALTFFNKSPSDDVAHQTTEIEPPDAHETSVEKDTQGEKERHEAGSADLQKHPPQASESSAEKLLSSGEPVGYAFVTAAMKPLQYELEERFLGWRPNDIIEFTDNVNNYQLGVLEVTRRSVEKLTDSISRTGSTASFDNDLEEARNSCFSIKADRYWFPSPESRYKAGFERLMIYRNKLVNGGANFFNRADNVIPLLMEYENILGSCDDNLVKEKEEDGRNVSFFKADNYFYYAKGVSSALVPILEAINEDFQQILESRHGSESLNHAIESCKHASKIEPWIVTDSDLSGILANHRANMASHISHARFYIGVLIKTLST